MSRGQNNIPVENKEQSKKRHRPTYIPICLITLMFVALFAVMGYHLYVYIEEDSENFIYNSYNARFGTYSDKVVRGDIETSDGKVLATTVTTDGTESRSYPYSEMFSHVVGYVTEGMAGLEKEYTFDLLKTHISYKTLVENETSGTKSMGDTLVTTLDYDAQEAAYNGMGYYKGAVIAIEPSTGKVICMVSKPDFDPNTIESYWDFITDEENDSSILLNRATAGLYPPGSTFKIVTTLAYMRQNSDYDSFSYNCDSTLTLDDYIIHCASNKSHGSVNLEKAFAKSCNCAFATIGSSLNINKFNDTAEDLLLNKSLPTSLTGAKKCRFSLSEDDALSLVGQTAIGQGNTAVTPLYMAMLVSAVANDGELMEPYVVDHFESAEGDIVSQTDSVSYGSLMSEEEAETLQEYMKAVVESGTADDVDFGDLDVYGKTGTAQYSDEDGAGVHSWFVGYAKNSRGKEIAIAVIMEEAGSGAKYAAPLAASVFKAYLD